MKKILLYSLLALCLVFTFALSVCASGSNIITFTDGLGQSAHPFDYGLYEVEVFIDGSLVFQTEHEFLNNEVNCFSFDHNGKRLYIGLTFQSSDVVVRLATNGDLTALYSGFVELKMIPISLEPYGIGEFFTQSVSWLGDVLDVIVHEPALLVMAIALPVIGFVVSMCKRFIF